MKIRSICNRTCPSCSTDLLLSQYCSENRNNENENENERKIERNEKRKEEKNSKLYIKNYAFRQMKF